MRAEHQTIKEKVEEMLILKLKKKTSDSLKGRPRNYLHKRSQVVNNRINADTQEDKKEMIKAQFPF